MGKILTPIKYFGGKSLLINKIKEYFPKEGTYNTYIEPFAGSFSIGLTVDCPNLIYNDLDKNVFSLYRVISDEDLFSKFKFFCDLAPYSEDIREQCKKELKRDDLSLLQRAVYFFYVNRTSHNGVGGFSINTVVRRNMSKSVSDYLSAIDRLPELHQKLSKVIVTNKNGIKLISKYDKKDVFFYLDPPYHWSTRTSARYKVDMNSNEQDELMNTLLEVKNAKILLSGYDCEAYSRLEQSGWNKFQFEVNTVDGNRVPKVKVESLWSNY